MVISSAISDKSCEVILRLSLLRIMSMVLLRIVTFFQH